MVTKYTVTIQSSNNITAPDTEKTYIEHLNQVLSSDILILDSITQFAPRTLPLTVYRCHMCNTFIHLSDVSHIAGAESHHPVALGYTKNGHLMDRTKSKKMVPDLDLIAHFAHPHRSGRTAILFQSLLPFVPRIAHTYGETRAVAVERDTGDCRSILRVLPQPLFDLVIPDRDGAI